MDSQFLDKFPYSQTSYNFAWYLYSYISFIDKALTEISLWHSFKEVNFAPQVFALLEPHTSLIIETTYQFFQDYDLSCSVNDQDILTFWSQEITHLFAPEYGGNIYGYILSNLSWAHWDLALDEEGRFLLPDPDLAPLINGYLHKRELPQQSFWDTEKARLQLEDTFHQWKRTLYAHQQHTQEATMAEIIKTVFPSYLETWKQACYWQHTSEMSQCLKQIHTNLYQEYHLQMLKDFWIHHIPQSLQTQLSRKEFTHILHDTYLNMYHFLNTTPSQAGLKFHLNTQIISLEEHMSYLLAYRLLSAVWQYMEGIYTLEDQLHHLPQEIQTEIPQTAFNTRFITMSKHLYNSLA